MKRKLLIAKGTSVIFVGPAVLPEWKARLNKQCRLIEDVYDGLDEASMVKVVFGEDDFAVTSLSKLSIRGAELAKSLVADKQRSITRVPRKTKHQEHFEACMLERNPLQDFMWANGKYVNPYTQQAWIGYEIALSAQRNRSVGTFIIAETENGRPTFKYKVPDTVFKPYVHTTYKDAQTEQTRLANLNPGKSFVIYQSIKSRTSTKLPLLQAEQVLPDLTEDSPPEEVLSAIADQQ